MNWQHAALVAKRTTGVSIVDCEFTHTAMTGLFVSMASNALVDRDVFTDIGYHGLLLLGDYAYENITVTNNYFNGSGITRYWSTSAIFAQGSRNVRIANNEVTRTMGNGIMIKSESLSKSYWADQGNTDYVTNVEYNYVHDFGVGVTNDFGGIKTGNKHCCDNFLYSDVSAGKNLFENNILTGSGSGALYHHCGLENESTNNLVHRVANTSNGAEAVSNMWGACEANSGKFQSFSNHHNIYCLDSTDNLKLYKSWNWFDEKTVFSDNLFYSLDPADEFKGMFPPSDLPFSSLPSVGSLRNQWADPGFRDAAAGDYLLTAASPAPAMGIQQIRLDNFGIA